MTFESDLYAALSGAAGLTALVGNRISPSHDQTPTAPYVVFTPIYGESFYTLAGASTMTRVRLQVDCYADHPDTAASIAEAVIAAIPQSGFLHRSSHSNQDFGMEEETRLFRRMVEFSVFHRSSS
jgi:hypothetical protein